MSEIHPPCGAANSASCAAPAALVLDDVLRRFEKEAQHGVCDSGRYRCPYYVWGSGAPLLFIHGMAEDNMSFVPIVASLSRDFRCIAYTLPKGRGDGASLSRYRHEDLVADVFALLDHLGVQQSYVLGASFGSTITLAALRAAPARLPRAILQGGFAQRRLATAELLLAKALRYFPGPIRWLPFRIAVMRRQHHAPFTQRGPEFWEFYLRRLSSQPISTVAHRAVMLDGIDLRATLPEIRQPVMILCGDCDPLVDKRCEEVLMRGLPHALRIELDHCGHLPQYSHPELMAELVRRFLTPPL